MGNINEKKYALTTLFPIAPGEHYAQLKELLRDLEKEPYGSPLSRVGCIHMARFVIIEDFVYQGLPAKRDHLQSRYLLFMCDFDGAGLDVVVGAMVTQIADTVHEIWQHCVAYPGRNNRDGLIAYFERCQLETSLFFADRPNDEVSTILRALMSKRQFVHFVEDNQQQPQHNLKQRFYAMWQQLAKQPIPPPGSM